MIIRLPCVFMPRSELNDIFDLGEDYYSGYFSDTELTDIKSQYRICS